MKSRKYVLMFHDVYETDPFESGFPRASSNSFKVSRPDFIRFIDTLILKANKINIPLSNIILTFDDGGSSFLWIARELSKRGVVGHFFISTGYIGTEGFCSEEDLKEIDSLGHVIGSHSHTHPRRISSLPNDILRKEWNEATVFLQNLLGKDVSEASIPGGYYSIESVNILRELGYKTIYTSKPTNRINFYKEVEIIGRYTVRDNQPIEQYLSYIDKVSFLGIKMLLRWQSLEIIKKLFGSYFDVIRKILKKY